jgi:hypothetical protein
LKKSLLLFRIEGQFLLGYFEGLDLFWQSYRKYIKKKQGAGAGEELVR